MTFNYNVRSKPYDLRGTEEQDVILAYAQLLDNCRPLTKEKLDSNQAQQYPIILVNAQNLLQKSFADVEREAAGNPSGLVDCAVRLYYGVGCRMDRKGAHSYFIKAAYHPSANDTVKATAHAILVEWYTTALESLRSPSITPIKLSNTVVLSVRPDTSFQVLYSVLGISSSKQVDNSWN